MTSDVAAAFPQDYLATECTQDGDIIAVPMYIDILHFWVDQRVLDEIGMEAPTTKEEFLEFVSKATNGSERYGYGGLGKKPMYLMKLRHLLDFSVVIITIGPMKKQLLP